MFGELHGVHAESASAMGAEALCMVGAYKLVVTALAVEVVLEAFVADVHDVTHMQVQLADDALAEVYLAVGMNDDVMLAGDFDDALHRAVGFCSS